MIFIVPEYNKYSHLMTVHKNNKMNKINIAYKIG